MSMRRWLVLTLVAALSAQAPNALACPGCAGGGGRPAGADAASAGSRHSSYVTAEQPAPPQQFCPVCNGRLTHGTPVTVAYSVAMTEPKTFWQKIGLRAAKPPRQVPFHYKVCSAECATRAEQDAGSFYVKTFSERGGSR